MYNYKGWTVDTVLDTPKEVLDRLYISIARSNFEESYERASMAGAKQDSLSNMRRKFDNAIYKLEGKSGDQVESQIDPMKQIDQMNAQMAMLGGGQFIPVVDVKSE